jgi:hypothetical protein
MLNKFLSSRVKACGPAHALISCDVTGPSLSGDELRR